MIAPSVKGDLGAPFELGLFTPRNVVEEVIMKMTLDTLQNALCSLSEEEYDLIDSIFLSRIETEKTYAKKNGYSQSTIHYRKQQILDKLKKFF